MGRTITAGDVALLQLDGLECCQVVLHLIIDGVQQSLVQVWPTVRRETNSFHCKVSRDTILIDASCLVESCIYSTAEVGQVARVLIPPLYRELV